MSPITEEPQVKPVTEPKGAVPPAPKKLSEEESRQVAEEARQDKWEAPSFLKELFAGNFNLRVLTTVPPAHAETDDFKAFYARLKTFLETKVDSDKIDRDGQYPPEVIKELAEMGAFGMKIPKEYGGLGFTQAEYAEIIKLVSSWDGNLIALLSAHQSIGVPQPLKLFGTEEQKKKY
ncbi:MAG TPA: acyl-CoA dehydrogenase family protein, partial [Holophagaceae bacterium]|nr:acyl-CoA dehydrogenase family protein [Holophagaceae bacterium]